MYNAVYDITFKSISYVDKQRQSDRMRDQVWHRVHIRKNQKESACVSVSAHKCLSVCEMEKEFKCAF